MWRGWREKRRLPWNLCNSSRIISYFYPDSQFQWASNTEGRLTVMWFLHHTDHTHSLTFFFLFFGLRKKGLELLSRDFSWCVFASSLWETGEQENIYTDTYTISLCHFLVLNKHISVRIVFYHRGLRGDVRVPPSDRSSLSCPYTYMCVQNGDLRLRCSNKGPYHVFPLILTHLLQIVHTPWILK